MLNPFRFCRVCVCVHSFMGAKFLKTYSHTKGARHARRSDLPAHVLLCHPHAARRGLGAGGRRRRARGCMFCLLFLSSLHHTALKESWSRGLRGGTQMYLLQGRGAGEDEKGDPDEHRDGGSHEQRGRRTCFFFTLTPRYFLYDYYM